MSYRANFSGVDGDFYTPFQAGLEHGRALKQERDQKNILGQLAIPNADPGQRENILGQLTAINPQLGIQLQQAEQQRQTFQQGQGDRTAQAAAAAAMASGNYKGAASALAPTGNINGVAAIQDQQSQISQQHAAALATFATRARSIQTPQGRLAALNAYEPMLRAAGTDDEDMQALRDGLGGANGDAILAALSDPAKLQEVSAGSSLVDPTNPQAGPVYTAPTKPTYQAVAPGGMLVRTDGGGAPQNVTPGAAQAPAAQPQIGVDQVENVLGSEFGGSQITSETRTAAHNAEVGGVDNSQHLGGTAMDFIPPRGATIDQVRAAFAAKGIPLTEALNEGDHFHIAWGPKGGELRPGPAPQQLAQNGAPQVIQGPAKPTYRSATAAEIAAAGLPAGTPAQVSPDGKIEPFAAGASLKAIPGAVGRAMADTQTAMGKIDSALREVDAYPQGLGLMNKLGDTVRQRTDPNGVKVRAAVADIGSQIIHDRSGAAVTLSETPRLLPFIPSVNDTQDAVKIKLNRLREVLGNDLANTQIEFGPDSGYRQNDQAPAAGGGRGGDPAPAKAPASPLPPQAVSQLKAGHNTTFGNGQVWTVSNGKPQRVK